MDSIPLNCTTIREPNPPKIKLINIIAFCAFDSLPKKKLKQ